MADWEFLKMILKIEKNLFLSTDLPQNKTTQSHGQFFEYYHGLTSIFLSK